MDLGPGPSLRYPIFGLLLVGAVTTPAHGTPDLETLVQEGIDAGFPGFVLVVDRPGAATRIEAAGLADVAKNEPLSTDHAFHYASITKLFAAVTALRLVDRGMLTLDAPLLERLPSDPRVAALPHASAVTIRSLLDHSSGFYATNNDPEYIRAWIGPDAGKAWSWGPAEFLALAARGEPLGLPGEGHFYSDTNYLLLGMVIEAATGLPYGQVLEQEVLVPLGLDSIYLFSSVTPRAHLPIPTVRGYLQMSDVIDQITELSDRFPEVRDGLRDTTEAGERLDAVAGLVGTAGDLAALGRAVFGTPFLSSESRAILLESGTALAGEPVGSEAQRTTSAYRRADGILVTAEGDGPGGSNTLLAYHPGSDTIIVALTNIFGLWSESDFFLDRCVTVILAEESATGADPSSTARTAAPGRRTRAH